MKTAEELIDAPEIAPGIRALGRVAKLRRKPCGIPVERRPIPPLSQSSNYSLMISRLVDGRQCARTTGKQGQQPEARNARQQRGALGIGETVVAHEGAGHAQPPRQSPPIAHIVIGGIVLATLYVEIDRPKPFAFGLEASRRVPEMLWDI